MLPGDERKTPEEMLQDLVPKAIDLAKRLIDGKKLSKKEREDTLALLRKHGWEYVRGEWVHRA